MHLHIGFSAVLSVLRKFSLRMTITVGGGSVLMAYSIQSFQKFFVLLFVRIPFYHEESHMQICSESTASVHADCI